MSQRTPTNLSATEFDTADFDQDLKDGIEDDFDDETNPDDAFLDVDTDGPADGDDPDDADTDDLGGLSDLKDPDETNSDDTIVTLADGTEAPLVELEAAYTQRNEFAVEQETLANERVTLDETTVALQQRHSQLETQVDNLTQYLQRVIPPEPDRALLDTDPVGFWKAKQHREDVMTEVGQVLAIKQQVQAQGQQASQDDLARAARSAQAQMLKTMPALRDPKRLEAFDTENLKTATDLGFSEEEIANASDPRIRMLVHYAGIGKKVMHNRGNAKRRVNNAKSTKPTSNRRNSATAKSIDQHRQAYRKTGSSQAAEALAMAAFSED